MITKIDIENFRSIENASVELGPLTILYGPTASGKSSLLYALLVLRNFILNPNQQADGLFNLQFISFGGFKDCVFNHEEKKRSIKLAAYAEDDENGQGAYEIILSKSSAHLCLQHNDIELTAKVNIPYQLNQSFTLPYTKNSEEFTINWNGIVCSVSPKQPTTQSQELAQELTIRLNAITEHIKGIDIAPHRRGFFKGSYTPIGVPPTPITEDEVASIIINDQYMPGALSTYTEAIFGRDFRIYTPPGTATVFFQTTDKNARISVLLVNDGFGVNQIIYLLAKMLRSENRTLLIEEPEVHLHPTVIRNFAREVCKFVKEKEKQIILTTHSETFLSSVLTVVAEGSFEPEDLRCYWVVRDEKGRTIYKPQQVNEKGQIEGGLAAFIEAEIEDLKKFLKVGS
ncbi:MAG: AAA family ATPase [Candidatus Caldarchaeum sp.]